MDNFGEKVIFKTRRARWFKLVAGTLCFIFSFQQLASAVDFSSLSYNEKNYVETQGYSAQDFIKQMELDQDYLRRQYVIANTLNYGYHRSDQDLSVNLFGIDYERMKTAQELNQELLKAEGVFKRAGSGVSGFNFTEHENGKVVWTKNGLAEKIIGDPVKNKNGTITLRNTYNMQYNKKRLLTDYDAEIVDPRGNTTYVHWHDATYTADSKFYADEKTNANKHLNFYKEEVVDGASGNTTTRVFKSPVYEGKFLRKYTEELTDSRSPDKITEKVRYGIQYDSDHNMTEYKEDITEKIIGYNGELFTRVYSKEFFEGKYDADKNLLHSVDIVHDEYGSIKTEFTAVYNSLGELEKSSKIQTSQDGVSIKTDFTAITYDNHMQLMESEEVITDSRNADKPLVKKFKAGVGEDYGYNKLGDMTSYQEEWTDGNGRTISREWFGAEYTKQRQIAAYKEILRDETGAELYKEWKIEDIENGYDRLNHVKAFTEKTTLGDLAYERQLSSIRYDSLGQQSEYEEIYTITGTDVLGDYVDYNKTTNRGGAVYSESGELKGYQESSEEKAVNAAGETVLELTNNVFRYDMSTKGYKETRRMLGDGLDHTIKTERADVEYAPNKIVAQYSDKIVDSGSPDAYTLIKRGNIQFGVMNQVYGYDETIFNSATPGSGSDETKRVVSNSHYNLMGQLLSKDESVITVEGLHYNVEQRNTKYNGLGQEVSFLRNEARHKVKVLDSGEEISADVVSFVERLDTKYDKNGALESYSQTSQSDIDDLKRISQWQAISYNQHSQITSYEDQTQTVDRTTNGNNTNFIVTTARSNISYESLDMNDELKRVGLQGAYDEKVINSAAEDLIIEKQMRSLKYDSYGHTAAYIEIKHDYHKDDRNILDNVVVTTRKSSDYDNTTFELKSYIEEIEQLGDGDGDELYVKTTIERSNIEYDVYDRILNYKERTVSSAAPDRVTDVYWQAEEFDHNNQVVAYTQQNHETGGKLNKTTKLKREDIVFNSLNQIVAYTEIINSDSAEDKQIILKRANSLYNTLNQVSSYEESSEENSEILDHFISSTIKRSNIQYTRFSQLSYYEQDINSSVSSDLLTKQSLRDVSYNRSGQMFNWTNTQDGIAFDGEELILHTKNINSRSLAQYNLLGQLSAYEEDIITSYVLGNEVDDIKHNSVSGAIYDSKDRLFEQITSSRQGDLVIINNRLDTSYNTLGQIKAYNDSSNQNDSQGLELELNTSWYANKYNSKGQIVEFEQSVEGSGSISSGKKISRNENLLRDEIEYNDLGILISYSEKGSSLASGDFAKTWQLDSHDLSGRNSAYTEKGQVSSSGPYELSRTDILYETYHNNNQVKSYSEYGNNSGTIYSKDWLATAYDERSRLISSTETGFDSNRGKYTQQRNNSSYNSFNQLISFNELNINAMGGETNVLRKQSDYDENGRLYSFQQTSTDSYSNQTESKREYTNYNDKAQVLEYEQKDSAVGFDGLHQFNKTIWTAKSEDYREDGLNIRNKTVKVTSDVETNPGFVVNKTVDWEGLVYDEDSWKLRSYKEKSTTVGNVSDELPADYDKMTEEQKQAYQGAKTDVEINIVAETIRSDIAYNDLGLISSYNEHTEIDGNTETTDVKWMAKDYYDNGLLKEFEQTVILPYITKTVIRDSIEYDDNTRIRSYNEVENDGTFVTTNKMSNIEYDGLSKQFSWQLENIRSADGLELRTATTRDATYYSDSFITEFIESSSTDFDDIKAQTHSFGIVYGDRGNQIAAITESIRSGQSNVEQYTINGTRIAETDLKKLLDAYPLKSLSDLLDEGIIEKQATITKLDFATINLHINSAYDDKNNITESEDYSLNLDTDVLSHTKELGIEYDSKHRRISYMANIHKTADSTEGKIDIKTQVSRDNVVYNELNQIISYTDIEIRGVDVNKTQVVDIVYDNKNREQSRVFEFSRKNVDEDDAKYLLISRTRRDDQKYNMLGQLESYSDRVEETTADSNVLIREDNIDMQYNELGLVNLQLTRSDYKKGLRIDENGTEILSDIDTADAILVRMDMAYNLNGQLIGYTDFSSKEKEASYSINHTTDITYNEFEQQTYSLSESHSFSADGSLGSNVTKAYREYDPNGALINAEDEIDSSNRDVFGYYSGTSESTNHYAIINNQARLLKVKSNGNFSTRDLSGGTNTSVVTYQYDKNGYLIDAVGESTKENTDAFGNKSTSQSIDSYIVLNGQSVVVRSDTQTDTVNSDTSFTHTDSTVEYIYNNSGYLDSSVGYSDTNSDDGFGNTSISHTDQVYLILNNKAKQAENKTHSESKNLDGSMSLSDSVVRYGYDKFGVLDVEKITGSSNSRNDDGFGNITTSTAQQKYIVQHNQALVSQVSNESKTINKDGSFSNSESTTDYTYNSDTNHIESAMSASDSEADDGYGNITKSHSNQAFEIVNGQAKVSVVNSISDTINLDGSYSNSTSVTNNEYHTNGNLKKVTSTSVAESNDGYGSMTYTDSISDYVVIANQAKILLTDTLSRSESVDGTGSLTSSKMTYEYDKGYADKGILTDVFNESTGYSYEFARDEGNNVLLYKTDLVELENDFQNSQDGTYGFDKLWNITKTLQHKDDQTFKIIDGKQKQVKSVSESYTVNADGSSSTVESITNNNYSDNGVLESVDGSSESDSDDGWGNKTHASTTQAYIVVNGQAKVQESVTQSRSENLDGTFSDTENLTTNSYDSVGKLIGVSAVITTLSNDGFNNLTHSTVDQSYEIINGRSKVKQSVSNSHSENKDESSSRSAMTTSYSYDSNGILKSVVGSGTTNSFDGYSYTTTSTTDQEYSIIKGQSKQSKTLSDSISINSNDKTNVILNSELNYSYDVNGKIISADSVDLSHGQDAQANEFTSNSTKQYVLQNGQIRQSYVLTEKSVEARDGQWTKDITDEWFSSDDASINGYNGNGKLVSYKQITHEVGTGTLANLDLLMTTQWAADGFTENGGWLTGYNQVVATQANNSGYELVVTTDRTDIEYYSEDGKKGKIKGYTDRIVSSDSPDKIITNVVTDLEYNQSGQQVRNSYSASTKGTASYINNEGVQEEQEIDQVVSGDKIISYNDYGLANLIEETTVENGKVKQTITTSEYDDLARVVESTHQVVERSKEDNGARLNKSSQLIKTNQQYNVLGQLESWTEVRSSSDSEELETSIEVTAAYDDMGRMSKYYEDGQKRSIKNTNDNVVFLEEFTLDKTDIVYNRLGQAMTWRELTTNSSAESKEINALVTTRYYKDGSLKTSVRDVTETIGKADNQILDKSYKTKTQILAYNDLGQVLRKSTETKNQDGDIAQSSRNLSDNIYNQLGQLIEFKEEINESIDSSTNRIYTKEQNTIEYNELGQISSRRELLTEGNKVTERTSYADNVYNSNGQLTFIKDLVYEHDVANVELVRRSASFSEMVYDVYGRLVESQTTMYRAQNDSVISDVQTYKEIAFTVNKNIDWNDQGQVIKSESFDYGAIREDKDYGLDAEFNRDLLSREFVEVLELNDFGKTTKKQISTYAFDGTLSDIQIRENLSFNEFGSVNHYKLSAYAVDGEQQLLDSNLIAFKEVERKFDDLARLVENKETSEITGLGKVVNEKKLSDFSIDGQAGYIYTTVAKSSSINVIEYQTSSERNISYDGYGNSLAVTEIAIDNEGNKRLNVSLSSFSEQGLLKGNAEMTESFEFDYFDPILTGEHRSNYDLRDLNSADIEAVSQIIKDKHSDEIRKYTVSNNTLENGYIKSTISQVYAGDLNELLSESLISNTLDSSGNAVETSILNKSFSGSDEFNTSYILKENSIIDRNGTAVHLKQSNYTDDINNGGQLVDYSYKYLYTPSFGTVSKTKHFLPAQGNMIQDRELLTDTLWQVAKDSSGDSLATVMVRTDSESNLYDKKTFFNEYDAFGNSIKQSTEMYGVEDGEFVKEYLINSQNNDFNIYGKAHVSTNESYRFEDGDYVALNKTVTTVGEKQADDSYLNGFDSYGNVIRQTVDTSLFEAGVWQLNNTIAQNYEYDGKGREIESTVVKFDSSARELMQTVVESIDFDVYDNAQNKTTTIVTKNYDSNGDYLSAHDQVKTIHKQEIRSNSIGWELSYVETISDSYASDLVVTKEFGNATQITTEGGSTRLGTVVYDDGGNLFSYDEAMISSSVTPGDFNSRSETQRISSERDSKGVLKAYREINHQTSDSVYTFKEVKDIKTDGLSNRVFYNSTERKVGVDYDVTETNQRLSAEYDDYSRVIAYQERRASEATGDDKTTEELEGTIVDYSRDNVRYDYSSQTVSYDDVTISTRGSSVVTNSTSRSNQQYNTLGQLSSYDEESRTSSKPDLLTETSRFDIDYDSSGQIYSYNEQINKTGADGYSVIIYNEQFSAEYDANGFQESTVTTTTDTSASSVTKTISYEDTRYDELGRRNTYVMTESNLADGLNKTIYVLRDSTVYDSVYGRELSFLERSNSSDSNSVWTVVHKENMIYGEDALLNSYTETREKLGTGNVLTNTRNVTVRSDTSYNTNGFESSFSETVTNNATPGITTDYSQNNIVYDSNGNVYSYRAEDRKYGSGYDLTTKVNRTSSQYNDKGQLIYKFEEQHQSSAVGVWVDNEQSNVTYDLQGRVYSFDSQTVTIDTTINTNRNYTNYDSASGLITSYRETGDINGKEFDKTLNSFVYNSQDQITSFRESGFDSKPTDINFDQIDLSASDQQKANAIADPVARAAFIQGKKEALAANFNGFTYSFTRSSQIYDQYGQIASYHESGSREMYGQGTQSHNYTRTQKFNALGQLIEVRDSGSRYFAGPKKNRGFVEKIGYQYNDKGQIYKETVLEGRYTDPGSVDSSYKYRKESHYHSGGGGCNDDEDWYYSSQVSGITDGQVELINAEEEAKGGVEATNPRTEGAFKNDWGNSSVYSGYWQKKIEMGSEVYVVHINPYNTNNVYIHKTWDGSVKTHTYDSNNKRIRTIQNARNGNYKSTSNYNVSTGDVTTVKTEDKGKEKTTVTNVDNQHYYASGYLKRSKSVTTTPGSVPKTNYTDYLPDGTYTQTTKQNGKDENDMTYKVDYTVYYDAVGNAVKVGDGAINNITGPGITKNATVSVGENGRLNIDWVTHIDRPEPPSGGGWFRAIFQAVLNAVLSWIPVAGSMIASIITQLIFDGGVKLDQVLMAGLMSFIGGFAGDLGETIGKVAGDALGNIAPEVFASALKEAVSMAVSSAIVSAVSQLVTTGSVNWSQVGAAAMSGAIAGAVKGTIDGLGEDTTKGEGDTGDGKSDSTEKTFGQKVKAMLGGEENALNFDDVTAHLAESAVLGVGQVAMGYLSDYVANETDSEFAGAAAVFVVYGLMPGNSISFNNTMDFLGNQAVTAIIKELSDAADVPMADLSLAKASNKELLGINFDGGKVAFTRADASDMLDSIGKNFSKDKLPEERGKKKYEATKEEKSTKSRKSLMKQAQSTEQATEELDVNVGSNKSHSYLNAEQPFSDKEISKERNKGESAKDFVRLDSAREQSADYASGDDNVDFEDVSIAEEANLVDETDPAVLAEEVFSPMLQEGAEISNAQYEVGDNGLELVATAKVGDLKQNIQDVVLAGGVQDVNDSVDLVKDFANDSTYVKFDIKPENLEAVMGDEFTQALEGMVKKDDLKDAVVGNIEGRVYVDDKGNITDKVVVMQIKTSYLTDEQSKTMAEAAGADTVTLELSEKNDGGQLEFAVKTSMTDFLQNLENNGLSDKAAQIKQAVDKQVKDKNSVSDVKVALFVEKVNGKFKSTGLKRISYATRVDNLNDSKIKDVANVLGLTDVNIVTEFTKEGDKTSYISDMQVNGEALTDANVNALIELDSDMGMMMKSLQKNVLKSGIKNPGGVDVKVKSVINNKGQMFITLSITTDPENITDGSDLAARVDKTLLNSDGKVEFAIASNKPNTVLQLNTADAEALKETFTADAKPAVQQPAVVPVQPVLTEPTAPIDIPMAPMPQTPIAPMSPMPNAIPQQGSGVFMHHEPDKGFMNYMVDKAVSVGNAKNMVESGLQVKTGIAIHKGGAKLGKFINPRNGKEYIKVFGKTKTNSLVNLKGRVYNVSNTKILKLTKPQVAAKAGAKGMLKKLKGKSGLLSVGVVIVDNAITARENGTKIISSDFVVDTTIDAGVAVATATTSAAAGMAIGAMAGSVFPGVGTVVGAASGFAIGYILDVSASYAIDKSGVKTKIKNSVKSWFRRDSNVNTKNK